MPSTDDLERVTSGRVGSVRWWTRQLTGTPHITRGYIEYPDADDPSGWAKVTCGHNHYKVLRARSCARTWARQKWAALTDSTASDANTDPASDLIGPETT